MKALLKILSYPFSILFFLLFGILLLLFEVIQRVALNFFGYEAHKKSVGLVNGLFVLCLHLVGTTFKFTISEKIPNKVPIIIVSNHQSLWDIPPIIWFLRRLHPKFISKMELGKGIPTVSYNLRKGGSVLIDRKNPKQATAAIKMGAEYISKYNRSLVIFPEGTRSREGVPKPFRRSGLITLFQHAPQAYVLPISINNSWKLQRYGMFPIPLGTRLTFYVHPVLKVSDYEKEALIDIIESQITSRIV
ncbi:MAG: lysophospholipid acyltransferase family protein [Flavobacteriaceae bacterium]